MPNTKTQIKRGIKIAGLLSIVVSAASARGNTLLNLPQYDPRVGVGLVSVSYVLTAGNTVGLFTATGTTSAYTLPGASSEQMPIAGSFTLTAHIDTSGHGIDGLLTVTGSVIGDSSLSPLIQTGNLLNFGSGPSKKFEFMFAKGNGKFETLNTNHFPFTGVLIDAASSENGTLADDPDFTHSFYNNPFTGKADAFMTPLPTAAGGLAVLLASIGIAGWMRRNRVIV